MGSSKKQARVVSAPSRMQAGNVLLKTHRIDRRGYIAKVADFGASL